MKSPCYKCENRTLECHSSCDDYKNYTLNLKNKTENTQYYWFSPSNTQDAFYKGCIKSKKETVMKYANALN